MFAMTGREDEDDNDELRSLWRLCGDRNCLPPRPQHFAVRPGSDPRADPARYVRFDPRPEVKTGAIFIVLPGGNYDECGVDCAEGRDTALWLTLLGITAVVLEYRVRSQGHFWPAQLEDFIDCAVAVRRDAEKWGCDEARIGVIGFSAGGHLASTAAQTCAHEIRPKLQILVYPAIDTTSPHDRSSEPWQAALGYPPVEASTHLMVNSDSPPAFLASIGADTCTPHLENVAVYEEALKIHGIPCETVVNDDKELEHGCGICDWWTLPCEEWLRRHSWAA